ncbi:hypothetical protein HPP92_008876 [Vanilla planifolia]|uniref:Uncharacterized protein n=1 Tax=Vanilla planifolia TaxID=51239 RepID=A0A835RCS1_VANPL|nr:hypothetical protein HPP92_008876 [Vanilla planifolia]
MASRASRGIISLQSLLPFHSAVSSARLTSRLGFDAAAGSKSLCLARFDGKLLRRACPQQSEATLPNPLRSIPSNP